MTNKPEDDTPSIALALSGGGLRASFFHLGVLRRLSELGWLQRVSVVSAVSGGSIIAAFAALRWQKMLDAGGDAAAFVRHIAEPFGDTVAQRSLIGEWARGLPLVALRKLRDPSFSRTEAFGELLDTVLYDQKLCADLPERPYVILNATSLISIRSWRFTRDGLSTETEEEGGLARSNPASQRVRLGVPSAVS